MTNTPVMDCHPEPIEEEMVEEDNEDDVSSIQPAETNNSTNKQNTAHEEAPRHTYNLRSITQSQNKCNSVIIHETPRMMQKTLTTKYGEAIKYLVQTELMKAYELQEQIWFASAILDPDTGKQLE